ncbi:MAG: hypothetical protein AAF844_01540 [Pseudomonadota bacterium]
MSQLPGYSWEPRPDDHIPGLDPVGAWLLGEGRDFEDAAIDRDRDGAHDFRSLAAIDESADPVKAIRDGDYVRVISGGPDAGLAELKQALKKDAGEGCRYFALPLRDRSFVDKARLEGPVDDAPWTARKGIKSKKVVITGIIDHGINIAHARFQHAKRGSRVDFAWIQGAPATSAGGAPKVPFGREWTGPEITAAIAASAGDEMRALRQLDLVDFTRVGRDPLSNRVSHGTHVLDLAAGAVADDDAAVAHRIVAVDLPERVIEETSGGLIALCFIQALDYILRRARRISAELGKAVPVVLNFSLSRAGGPDGGKHIAARAMEALIAAHQEEVAAMGLTVVAPVEGGKARVEIVLPSGNRRQAQGHASTGQVKKGQSTLSLPWRVQPGDRTPSYLEFWLPEDAEKLALTIGWPGSAPLDVPLAFDVPQVLYGPGGAVARVTLDTREDGVPRVFVALAPSDAGASGRRPAPSGIWQVALSATLPTGGRINAHVLRDDTALGFAPRGRQSYLDYPDYARLGPDGDVLDVDPVPVGPVRRDGAFNGMAGGVSPLVVAGYRQREAADRPGAPGDWPALYAGAPAAGSSAKLSASGVSDRSRLHSGVLAAGSLSGSTIAMNGTSVAAPQMARAIAVALMSGAAPVGPGWWQSLLTAPSGLDPARLGSGLLPALSDADGPAAH